MRNLGLRVIGFNYYVMKNTRYLLYILMAFVMLSNVSCNNFLDELPDNRTALDDKEKIKKLLVSAYSEFDYSVVTELSSDNVADNGKTQYSNKFYDDIALWKEVREPDNNNLSYVWEGLYAAIANANQALEAIEKMGDTKDLAPLKAEALMARAYNHFILVNLFSKHYNQKTSTSDLGIPYITNPEITLKPKYERGTVAQVYENINKDIEEALPLLNDNIYEVPKYHFNKMASYAFAAKFNLYFEKWDKTIQYTNVVLGSNPASKLRDWKATRRIVPQEFTPITFDFVQASNKANLLLQTSMSKAAILFGYYNYPIRVISHKVLLRKEGLLTGNTIWGKSSKTEYWVKTKEFQAKLSSPRMFYKFQDYDVVAQIGVARTVNVLFSTDETLLIKAEALIRKKEYSKALATINLWTNAYIKEGKKTLTLDDVNTFYNDLDYSTDEGVTQKKKLNPGFDIESGTQENLTHYLLQCKRVLTVHQGQRWFDIRRYGIEVNRYLVKDSRLVPIGKLTTDDMRKTFQLPQEVIKSGLTPNPR